MIAGFLGRQDCPNKKWHPRPLRLFFWAIWHWSTVAFLLEHSNSEPLQKWTGQVVQAKSYFQWLITLNFSAAEDMELYYFLKL